MSRDMLRAHRGPPAGLVGARWAPAPYVVTLTHGLALLCALLPLLVVDVPALVDYPNHLARMRILSDLDSSPDLQAIYTIHWAAIPNLAMDLLVPQMASILGVIAAGKVFVAMTLALNAAGVAAVQKALYGRVGLWPLVTYLVLYNYILAYGFLNFLFGVGLFLLLFAFWIASDGWPWARRLAVAALGTLAIFFSHLGAFATYGLCVAGYELERWLRSETRSPGELLRAALPVVAQCLPPSVLMLTLTPSLLGRLDFSYELSIKILAPLVPVLFYREPLDFALFAVLSASLVFAMHGERLQFAPMLRLPAKFLALSVLAVPTWALDNFGNDFRLVMPLIFLLIAGSRVNLDRTRTLLFTAIGVLLFAVRILTIAEHWVDYDRLYSEVRTAARQVEAGARVLPAVGDWAGVDRIAPARHRRVFYHVSALLPLERPVFLPSLFTAQGRQPLSVQPAYASRDLPQMEPLPMDKLVEAIDPGSRELPRPKSWAPLYDTFAGWPTDFDYLLLLDFGLADNPLPQLLTLRHRGSFFTLYEVLHAED